MSNQLQQNETRFIDKIWTDDDTLDEIVDYEFKKKNQPQYIQTAQDALHGALLHNLGDWKRLCTRFNAVERSNKLNFGLVLLLDEVAGIVPKYVSSQKNQKNTGSGGRYYSNHGHGRIRNFV
jgi:histidyl-tRNA synthetase